MYLHMSIKVLRDVQTLSVSSLYRLGHWSKNLGSLGPKLRFCQVVHATWGKWIVIGRGMLIVNMYKAIFTTTIAHVCRVRRVSAGWWLLDCALILALHIVGRHFNCDVFRWINCRVYMVLVSSVHFVFAFCTSLFYLILASFRLASFGDY